MTGISQSGGRARRAVSIALGGALLGVALDCGHAIDGGASKPPAAVGSTRRPGWLDAPLDGGLAATAASAGCEPRAASCAPPEPLEIVPATAADPGAVFDPEAVVPVLADPRLGAVRDAAAREAWREAAQELARRLAEKDAARTAAEDASWHHQLGLLRQRAGDPLGAVRAFDQAAAAPEPAASWPLAGYARYLAAALLLEAGEPREALARLDAVEPGTALDGDVVLARARALAALGDVDGAAALWRGWLAASPRPRGWQDVALRFGRALLERPREDRAEEAVRVARLVIHASPGGRGVGEAREIERQALATLPLARRRGHERPAGAELAERARDLVAADQTREALAAADAALRELGATPAACGAHLARGQALAALRRHVEASDAFGVAADRCTGEPDQPLALFHGGRAALRAGQPALARLRWSLLERLYAQHRLADDARLGGAEAARVLGDMVAFHDMLARIDEAYPDGDVVDDALFALALSRIEASDWAGAVAPLERSVRRAPAGRPYDLEGRPQYWLARARLGIGRVEQGLAELESVVRVFPLSYYALLAYARLAHHDRERARRAVREALATEPEGSFVIPDHPELGRPAFRRAVELVRQGDGRRALGELDRLGARDGRAHPSIVWAGAFLLARIDEAALSHGLLRTPGASWKTHHPAGVWRRVWELAYPRPWHAVVGREAKRWGIPEHLAYGVMREESAFEPRAVSPAGAVGLMQLIVPTAERMARTLGIVANEATLKRPEVNVPLGCRFLSQLVKRFGATPHLAVPAYNAGPGAPARWLRERASDDFDLFVERIPYTETRRYTKRVLRSMAAYAVLYGAGLEDKLVVPPLTAEP